MKKPHDGDNGNPVPLYQRNLERTNKIVATLLDHLEMRLNNDGDEKQPAAIREDVLGAKETALSALAKLAQLQIRMLPYQQDAQQETGGEDISAQRKEYMEILERIFRKRMEQGRPLLEE